MFAPVLVGERSTVQGAGVFDATLRAHGEDPSAVNLW
jgi:hypothetical protein